MSNNSNDENQQPLVVDDSMDTTTEGNPIFEKPAAAALVTTDNVPVADGRQELPWVEKYRPNRLEDLVAHTDIVSILTRLVDSDNLPHLLLYGPPGTGKTSTIVAVAKRMYQSKYKSMTLELNASDTRGIDVVRNEIKEFAGTKQLFTSGIKLIILDEADAMTSDAQFALRRIMEKYTKNCRFCLIGNYVSKIIPALQSRCTRFRFAPLTPAQITDRLSFVADQEKVGLQESGKQAILRLSGGDMRRVLNLLQATSMSFPTVDETGVYLTSGAPLPSDLTDMLTTLMNQTFQEATESLTKLCYAKGYALVDVITDLTAKLLEIENMPKPALAHLLNELSNIEHRLAFGTTQELQMASLVACFVQARHLMK
eukprot:CAMPEP_0198138182 /NCGR_PEP_ID=MMETSP1443-20131203/1598_1 /TAXON_ID=186043 /ORGANISM="Entomoneis sp., Strain CCMP2396" /LENGTH=369 /DNA_ID=CAMNT_0043799849 /DNA_START=141 /DNA_END=1250 /DNA_ORIENTATION=-